VKDRVFSLEIVSDNGSCFIPCNGSETIMALLRREGIALSAPCGGKGRCGKCRVTVTGSVRFDSCEDIEELHGEEVLACQSYAAGACRVVLPALEGSDVLSAGAGNIAGGGKGLGIAVDIGTTTVAMLLYDLESGVLLGEEKSMNVQRAYGADVLSRIEQAKTGALDALCNGLYRQLADMAKKLCVRCGRKMDEIFRLVICGNTILEHFAAGLDPSPIAVPPFTPCSLFGAAYQHSNGLRTVFREADIYFCPCLSGYVGGDMLAGLSVSGLDSGSSLYMDIGTNGEIALGDNGSYICCATAAGPAFEGAELSCGMSGGAGAIDRVDINGDDISVHVIGETAARGICGSGVIDAVYALLRLGVIGKSGRFAKKDRLSPALAERLSQHEGKAVFMLADNVWLSSVDIRNIQLAKAAIRAGAETLLKLAGKSVDDLDFLVIAGGFGSSLRVESAIGIGLLPEIPVERVRFAGNAALTGAAAALNDAGRKKIEGMAPRCTYLDLSSDKTFPDFYLKELNFI